MSSLNIVQSITEYKIVFFWITENGLIHLLRYLSINNLNADWDFNIEH